MLSTSNKYVFYEKLCPILSKSGFLITPYLETPEGLQFSIEYQGNYGTITIKENTKGIKLDLSGITDKKVAKLVGDLIIASDDFNNGNPNERSIQKKDKSKNIEKALFENPVELIGITEQGTADYFGPLIVAAVHVKNSMHAELEELGVKDYKKLTDRKILKIAPKIRDLCFHSVVIVANQTYNELYQKFSNLHHILAWGYARVLENTLNQVPCPHALSSQFVNSSLINGALMRKGKAIQLFQKPDADSHISVAAANIIAKESYLKRMEEMNKSFNMSFPKGASKKVLEVAKKFVNEYGEDYLIYVSKLNFDITKEIN
jgi:ribonuclease HIII